MGQSNEFCCSEVVSSSVPPDAERPNQVNAARKDTQEKSVFKRNVNQHVVGQNLSIHKRQCAVLGSFGRCDVSPQTDESRSEILPRLAENPPLVSICCSVVLIPLRFDTI